MTYYKVEITIWPYSTHDGAKKDREKVGAEHQSFNISANDFNDACEKAKLILSGIKTNPAVWKTFVTAIHKIGDWNE